MSAKYTIDAYVKCICVFKVFQRYTAFFRRDFINNWFS